MRKVLLTLLMCSSASASSSLVLPPPPPPAGPVAGHELLLDPGFAAGLTVIEPCKNRETNPDCASPGFHESRNAYHSRNHGLQPAWSLVQWESNHALPEDSASVDGGNGFVTPAKRVIFYRDGKIRLSVNGAVEFGGSYQDEPAKLLTLQQTVSSPGEYSRPSGRVAEMNQLLFSLDLRRVEEKQNKQSGFNSDRHGVRFPVSISLLNTNPEKRKNKEAAEEIRLELVAYDDREEKPFRTGEAPLNGAAYVHSIPYRDAASATLHDEKWVHFEADLLSHAKTAIEAAFAKGRTGSADPADFSVGSVRIGYEVSGLNTSTMELKNISLKVSAASLLAPEPAEESGSASMASTSGASRAPGPAASSTKSSSTPAAKASAPTEAGFYRAEGGDKTVFSADGAGNYCAVPTWDSFLQAGGRADHSNVKKGKPAGKYTGHCFGNQEIKTIFDRLYAKFIAQPGKGSAKTWLAHQDKSDGSWSGKDSKLSYVNETETWNAGEHLKRIRTMALAYRTNGSEYYESKEMLNGITKGLDFWFDRKPTALGWFDNQIAQQLDLEAILVLMRGSIPDELLKRGIAFFRSPQQAEPGMGPREARQVPKYVPKFPTGENLVWFAEQQLIRGVLLQNEKDIAEASDYIQQAFKVRDTLGREMTGRVRQWTTGEGLQMDSSYFQHGPMIYNGGYGLGALNSATEYGNILKGTEFGFSDSIWKNMSECVLGGTGFMVRGPMLDLGSRGRYISRAGTMKAAESVAEAAEELIKANAPRAGELNALVKHIRGEGKGYSALGNKHFWNADVHVHQRESYYTSVKMVSSRTKGTESLQEENFKGYWLPYGMNLIARDGTEYPTIPPLWDWEHLPGVTSPEWLPKIVNATQPEAFVGGVSDKQYGLAAMKFQAPSEHTLPDKSSTLRAQKAWFFFDEEFVALGTEIYADDDAVVNTTLNQTLLKGDVLADGAKLGTGKHELKKKSWVLHDRVGYVFPDDADVTVKSENRTGSWKDINAKQSATPQKGDVFTLWVTHGKKPRAASYSYVVVPDTDAGKLAKYARKPPVQILANTKKLQAVKHHGLKINQAVFYEAGTLKMGGGFSVYVNQPAFVMIKPEPGEEGAYWVTVSSPVAPEVELTLRAKEGSSSVTYKLPTGARLGSSYAKLLKLTKEIQPATEVPKPREFFRVNGGATVFLTDGKGNYCSFKDVESYLKAGGSADWSNVSDLKGYPNGKHSGTCAP